jgi:hypothetical protein
LSFHAPSRSWLEPSLATLCLELFSLLAGEVGGVEFVKLDFHHPSGKLPEAARYNTQV